MITSGMAIKVAICEALGLDAKFVRSLTVELRLNDPITARAEVYVPDETGKKIADELAKDRWMTVLLKSEGIGASVDDIHAKRFAEHGRGFILCGKYRPAGMDAVDETLPPAAAIFRLQHSDMGRIVGSVTCLDCIAALEKEVV